MLTFRPIDASKECGVTVNTIRNWCKDYAPYLSLGAGVEGASRVLTEEDIEKLKYIALLRSENLQKHQIILRLQETTFGNIEPSNRGEIALQTYQDAPETPSALTVVQSTDNALQERVVRLEALAERSQHNRMSDIVLGFLLACGFLIVILLLALLYGR